MVFKAVNGLEQMDRSVHLFQLLGQNLMIRADGKKRGNEYRVRKARHLHDVKKFRFPGRNNDIWNGMDTEGMKAYKNPEFKTRLDQCIKGDRRTGT